MSRRRVNARCPGCGVAPGHTHLPRCGTARTSLLTVWAPPPRPRRRLLATLAHRLRPTRSVTVARVKPGDLVVLSVPTPLTSEQAHGMAAQLRLAFPDNRCVILAAGERIELVRPEDLPGAPGHETAGGRPSAPGPASPPEGADA